MFLSFTLLVPASWGPIITQKGIPLRSAYFSCFSSFVSDSNQSSVLIPLSLKVFATLMEFAPSSSFSPIFPLILL